MTHRYLQLAWALCCGCLCLFATPHSHARKGVTQGYVDLKIVLGRVCDGHRAKKKLRAIKDRYQRRLDRQKANLTRLRRAYRRSKRARATTRRKLQTKMQLGLLQLRRSYSQLSQRLKRMENREMGKLLGKMRRLIRTLARRHKLIFVFERERSSLLYAQKDRDFTDELIRLYHKVYCRGARLAKPKTPKKKAKKLQLRLKELGIETQ